MSAPSNVSASTKVISDKNLISLLDMVTGKASADRIRDEILRLANGGTGFKILEYVRNIVGSNEKLVDVMRGLEAARAVELMNVPIKALINVEPTINGQHKVKF